MPQSKAEGTLTVFIILLFYKWFHKKNGLCLNEGLGENPNMAQTGIP